MSIASYVEFLELPRMQSGTLTPAVPSKPLAYGELDFSAGEASATLNPSTRAVYVSVDAICRVRGDGTATATVGYRLIAGQYLVISGPNLSSGSLSVIGGS